MDEEIVNKSISGRTDAYNPAVKTQIKQVESTSKAMGRYVYGIASSGERISLGLIGIEGTEAYTIPYRSLCAIVHDCPAEPYQSGDDEKVKSWVMTHQKVLDEAKKRFYTIIPLNFDTILQPTVNTISSNQVVKDWLKENYNHLLAVMDEIKGKDEYGVQVSYKPNVIGKQISEQSDEVRKIREEMASKTLGIAYIDKQRLERIIRAEMEKLADKWFKDLYSRIKRHCDDIVVEKTKKTEKDAVMLLNLSCLVTKENVESLGDELERINNTEGFSVHFSGPWPPYSFVTKSVISAGKEE